MVNAEKVTLTIDGPEELGRLKLVALLNAGFVRELCEEFDIGEIGEGARLSTNKLSSAVLL